MINIGGRGVRNFRDLRTATGSSRIKRAIVPRKPGCQRGVTPDYYLAEIQPVKRIVRSAQCPPRNLFFKEAVKDLISRIEKEIFNLSVMAREGCPEARGEISFLRRRLKALKQAV